MSLQDSMPFKTALYLAYLVTAVCMAAVPQVSNFGNLVTYTVVSFIILGGVVHLFHKRDEYKPKGGKSYKFVEFIRFLLALFMFAMWLTYSSSIAGNMRSNSVDVYACAWSNTTNCISGNTTTWSTNSICGGAYNAKYPIIYSVMEPITDMVYAKYTIYTFAMILGLLGMKDFTVKKAEREDRPSKHEFSHVVNALFWLCLVADVLINCLYNYNVLGSSFELTTSNEPSYIGLIVNAWLAFVFTHTAGISLGKAWYTENVWYARTGPVSKFVNNVSWNAEYVIISFFAMELYTQSLLFSDSVRVLGYVLITMFLPMHMSSVNIYSPLNETSIDHEVTYQPKPNKPQSIGVPALKVFKTFATCNAVYYLLFTGLYTIWEGSYVANQFVPYKENAWAFVPSLWCGPFSWNIQEVAGLLFTLTLTALGAMIGAVIIAGSLGLNSDFQKDYRKHLEDSKSDYVKLSPEADVAGLKVKV